MPPFFTVDDFDKDPDILNRMINQVVSPRHANWASMPLAVRQVVVDGFNRKLEQLLDLSTAKADAIREAVSQAERQVQVRVEGVLRARYQEMESALRRQYAASEAVLRKRVEEVAEKEREIEQILSKLRAKELVSAIKALTGQGEKEHRLARIPRSLSQLDDHGFEEHIQAVRPQGSGWEIKSLGEDDTHDTYVLWERTQPS